MKGNSMTRFDGETFDQELDGKRLTSQLEQVFRLMVDSKWRTLSEISGVTGGSESGVSARLRDFRKSRFGSHEVQRRRKGQGRSGLWEYRLIQSR